MKNYKLTPDEVSHLLGLLVADGNAGCFSNQKRDYREVRASLFLKLNPDGRLPSEALLPENKEMDLNHAKRMLEFSRCHRARLSKEEEDEEIMEMAERSEIPGVRAMAAQMFKDGKGIK